MGKTLELSGRTGDSSDCGNRPWTARRLRSPPATLPLFPLSAGLACCMEQSCSYHCSPCCGEKSTRCWLKPANTMELLEVLPRNRLPSCKRNLTLSRMSKMKSFSFSGLSLLEVLLWLVLLPLEAVMMSMILAAYGNHVGTMLMSVICAAIRSRVLSLWSMLPLEAMLMYMIRAPDRRHVDVGGLCCC